MGDIPLVDDDPTVYSVVSDYLRIAGHSIIEAFGGISTLELADGYDLMILDLMLPGIDGLEVFWQIHSRGVVAPVIIFTAKGLETDRVLGLELDADDYLARPFSPRELVSRVDAALRQQQPRPERETITNGNLTLDLTARKATLAGETLALTLREFDLLAHLVTHPEEAFSHEELMHVVWGWDISDAPTVMTHMQRLHRKVEPGPQHPTRLVTVWGHEYR